MTNDVRCSECGAPIEPEESETRQPCSNCGSTDRTVSVSVSEQIHLFDNVRAELTAFLDTSSDDAEQATATALNEITTWVDQSNTDTVNHVADGNIPATKAGVPVGPYSDDEAKEIVSTVRRVRREAGDHAWDRKKTYGGWVITIVVVLIGAAVAVLKFRA